MIVLRNLAFYAVYYPVSTVMTLVAGLLLPLGPRPARFMTMIWSRFTVFCARHLLGIRIVTEGTVPGGGVIVAAKHESMFEAITLLTVLNAPVAVFKEELLSVPVWGRIALAYGVIPIVREAGASAVRKLLTQARPMMAGGRSLLIFPEGTRVAPGTRAEIFGGITALYTLMRVPVVPLAVNSGRLWPRKGWLRRPGIVTYRFGEAIAPGLPRQEIEARLLTEINALNADPGPVKPGRA